MSDEQEGRSGDPSVFNLDDAEPEPTGDPLVDRGMKLTVAELEEATADPQHPDHEAAKAATAYMGKKLGALFGDQFRRIGENIGAAIKPNLGNLFSAPSAELFHSASPPTRRTPAVSMPDLEKLAINETPQKTLEALLDLSERMSEMVRVAAEHRDVAVEQMTLAKREAAASRKSERWMLLLTWLALTGTWVAVVIALVSQ